MSEYFDKLNKEFENAKTYTKCTCGKWTINEKKCNKCLKAKQVVRNFNQK